MRLEAITVVTYVVTRNINYTNIAQQRDFCAFYRKIRIGCHVLPDEKFCRKFRNWSIPVEPVLLQGLHPKCRFPTIQLTAN